jgi:hypothetical protein
MFSTQICFLDVAGLEGNARPVGDDLEHSGTSQDDGEPVVLFLKLFLRFVISLYLLHPKHLSTEIAILKGVSMRAAH